MSKDPNNRVLGPKYCKINGIWALKPYGVGPWTLDKCGDTLLTSSTVEELRLKSLRLSPPTQRRRKHESLNAKP